MHCKETNPPARETTRSSAVILVSFHQFDFEPCVRDFRISNYPVRERESVGDYTDLTPWDFFLPHAGFKIICARLLSFMSFFVDDHPRGIWHTHAESFMPDGAFSQPPQSLKNTECEVRTLDMHPQEELSGDLLVYRGGGALLLLFLGGTYGTCSITLLRCKIYRYRYFVPSTVGCL